MEVQSGQPLRRVGAQRLFLLPASRFICKGPIRQLDTIPLVLGLWLLKIQVQTSQPCLRQLLEQLNGVNVHFRVPGNPHNNLTILELLLASAIRMQRILSNSR